MSSELKITSEKIEKHVYIIRNKHVVLDLDLAALYGIPIVDIKSAVKSNINRFPADHMFSLNKTELDKLKREIRTSSAGGMKYAPMAFTADGVNMLTSVLNSEKNPVL